MAKDGTMIWQTTRRLIIYRHLRTKRAIKSINLHRSMEDKSRMEVNCVYHRTRVLILDPQLIWNLEIPYTNQFNASDLPLKLDSSIGQVLKKYIKTTNLAIPTKMEKNNSILETSHQGKSWLQIWWTKKEGQKDFMFQWLQLEIIVRDIKLTIKININLMKWATLMMIAKKTVSVLSKSCLKRKHSCKKGWWTFSMRRNWSSRMLVYRKPRLIKESNQWSIPSLGWSE
jgi:hypothetical protein